MTTREQIHALACRHNGDWTKIAKDLKAGTCIPPVPAKTPYVTILDPEYPPCFRSLRYPPWILFYKGNLSLAHKRGIGMVGSRRVSPQGAANAKEVASILKRHNTIVSGLAGGVDSICHQEALSHATIGITGCGLGRTFPKENHWLQKEMEEHHLVLSEYPWNTPPLRHHFPWRNRLIAALSRALVVVECGRASGTMHTVNACLELGVPVYALSTPYGASGIQGCSALIEDGASILYDRAGVEELGRGKTFAFVSKE